MGLGSSWWRNSTHIAGTKIVDMNSSIREETGVEDASLKIYPVNG